MGGGRGGAGGEWESGRAPVIEVVARGTEGAGMTGVAESINELGAGGCRVRAGRLEVVEEITGVVAG